MLNLIFPSFEMHEIDQEHGAKQDSFIIGLQAFWKSDTEIVGVGKRFLEKAAPLFCNLAQLFTVIHYLKSPGMENRAEKRVHFFSMPIKDGIDSAQHGKPTLNFSDLPSV